MKIINSAQGSAKAADKAKVAHLPLGVFMEISPIIGVRMVPAIKAPSNEAVVSAEFDIQPAAWLGDDSYTGSGKKAAGGDEPEEEELDYEEVAETSVERISEHSTGISYIA